ncbi:MAG: type II CRISPR RNA-guided endonuclease Cas9 [Nitrosospira sp.]|nr:type II CRISPR RNA-guided endonuclease Cas9 [Nitrosospira sp.]
MIYRLGLDVGTASVGIAAVELNKSGEPVRLASHLVRIFDEPLENGTGGLVSKKAGRRKARLQRRQIDRRASRLRRIAHLGELLGLKRGEILPDDGNTFPRLRAQAATERVELADLLRIFLRMSKRRGYKGEFKENKKGEVAEGSSELERVMNELTEERGVQITLGQYLLHRLETGRTVRLKVNQIGSDTKGKKEQPEASDRNALKNLYTLRKMVEREFAIIWQTQSVFHDELNLSHDGKPLQEHFREALFYQRPLKSVADSVAQCSLEPTLSRAPRAQMAFQRFRIEKTLADLRWGAGRTASPLQPQQKAVIRLLLDQTDKIKFEDIYEALAKAGCPKPQNKGLNLDRASRDELLGNTTLTALRQLDKHSKKHHPDCAAELEKKFRALDEQIQITTINFLAEIGSPEQLDDSEWHTGVKTKNRKFRQFSGALIDFVNEIKEHDKFNRLIKMDFEGGRASYSVKALNKLADWMEGPNWPGDWQFDMKHLDEDAAIRVCYPESCNREVKQLDKLSAPPSTGNAVVDGALRQIRWTVNKVINELGEPPAEIVVELAREMSLGITRRNERERDNTKQQNARSFAEKEIRAHGLTPTSSRIRRYLLWAEQDKSFCPYCNKTIGITEALSGAATEYEHILPRSLTQVGMKRSEIVLAHHVCNHEKGNRTPWETWGNTAQWQSVEAAAARFESKKLFRKAKLLRLMDFEREVMTDESVNGFFDRQFHQTSWIAKETAQWLNCLCPNKVSVSRGEMTAMLRRKWGLETIIPEVRIESDLPVLDEEGKPITAEDFVILKKFLEGHPISRVDREANSGFNFIRRPDKRLDHRHHLIDAITLALTSRGLFQKMAKNYKTAAEKMRSLDGETIEERERRMKYETGRLLRLEAVEPPLRNIRTAALDAVRECLISIKPDRYSDGAVFKDTAYGVRQREGEEKMRLTLRQAVADLGKTQGKTSTEAARKAIANIVSDDVRRIVMQMFEARLATGMSAVDALKEPIIHSLYDKAIRKVRCFAGYAEDVDLIVHKSRAWDKRARCWVTKEHKKRLISAGYAFLEMATDGTNVVRPVKMRDALVKKNKQAKVGITRIYKGDTLFDDKTQKKYVVRQIKAQGGGMLVMSQITETRPIAAMSAKDGRLQPSGKGLARFKQI